MTVEGFCAELDPDFNLIKVCKPFMKKLKQKEISTGNILKKTTATLYKFKDFIVNLPGTTNDMIKGLKDADRSMSAIDSDLKKLNRNINRTTNIISMIFLFIGFMVISIMMSNIGSMTRWGISKASFIGFIISGIFLLFLLREMLKK